MQIPPSFHVVDLQAHVDVGSLYAESVPEHPVQLVAFVHPVQVLLQAKLFEFEFLFYKYEILLEQFIIIIFIIPVHIPLSFHAEDLQLHVYAGSLCNESEPLHVVQIIALVHSVQLLLHAIIALLKIYE